MLNRMIRISCFLLVLVCFGPSVFGVAVAPSAAPDLHAASQSACCQSAKTDCDSGKSSECRSADRCCASAADASCSKTCGRPETARASSPCCESETHARPASHRPVAKIQCVNDAGCSQSSKHDVSRQACCSPKGAVKCGSPGAGQSVCDDECVAACREAIKAACGDSCDDACIERCVRACVETCERNCRSQSGIDRARCSSADRRPTVCRNVSHDDCRTRCASALACCEDARSCAITATCEQCTSKSNCCATPASAARCGARPAHAPMCCQPVRNCRCSQPEPRPARCAEGSASCSRECAVSCNDACYTECGKSCNLACR